MSTHISIGFHVEVSHLRDFANFALADVMVYLDPSMS